MLHLNYYNISLFLGSISAFLWGAFVFFKNPKRLANKLFLLMSICCGIWSFGLGVAMGTDSKILAANVEIFFDAGAAFIVPLYSHFIFSILNKEKEQRKVLILEYIMSSCFAIAYIFFNQYMVKDMVSKYMFRYYPEPTLGYYFFGLYYLLFPAYAMYVLVKDYKNLTDFKKTQVKFMLSSSMVGFIGGGCSFLPTFNIMPPYFLGLYPLYPFLLAYAVIRYRLFEIDTVIHRTIMWLLASGTILAPVVLFIYFTRPILTEMNALSLGVLITLLFFVFKYYHTKFQPNIDHIFRRRKYDYAQMLSMLSLSLRGIFDVQQLSQKVAASLKEALYLEKISILAKDIETEEFLPSVKEGLSKDLSRISSQDSLITYLKDNSYLEPELIEVDPQLSYFKDPPLYRFLKEEDIPLVLPLKSEDDFIGLIILGKKQNIQSYTLNDIGILKDLSSDISLYFYNAIHHKDILEKERLEDEMKMGRQIQTSLLPQGVPQVPGLKIQGLMQPAKEIGGDYYDFITLPDKDNFAVVIGDVSGKGVAAGLLMAVAKTAIHTLSQEGFSPREILLRTNQTLYRNIGGQKFMTLLYLFWQARTNTLTYSSAGHEHILINRHQRRNLEVIMSGGFMLGMLPHIEAYLEEKQIKLDSGDKILLYTDGATEAENEEKERFGLERLKESFQRHSQKPALELMQAVKDEIYSFIGTYPQYDDITLVVMEAT